MSRRGENIYKRKDGRWEGRYIAGRDARGKTKYRSVYARSYREVREKLESARSAHAPTGSAGGMTVKVLFEEWLAATRLRVKASTYACYRMKADKHLLPAFGEMKFASLTAEMLHAFIQRKLNAGLSAKYVSDIIIVFKSMAKYTARVHDLRDPVVNVVLPKVQKKEIQLLTPAQQEHLCGHLAQHMDRTALCILLSLYAGLRIGEVCALRGEDIDLEDKVLYIKRAVQRIRTNGGTCLQIAAPKSKTSSRVIPLPEPLLRLLARFNTSPGSYLLSGNERIIEPRTLQYRFQSILKKADLPSIHYHGLRHMFATNCIIAGFDVKTLSELLGHAAVETTLERYVHSSLERKSACMALLHLAI